MDLSKYNDEDYEKLKKGDVQGMSDQGYLMYKQQFQQHQQAIQQSQNPQTIPDAAYKAAHPMQTVVDPKTAAADAAIKASKINPQGASAMAMQYADRATSPDEVGRLAGGLVTSSPMVSKLAGYLGQAGGAVKDVAGSASKAVSSGAAGDLLGVVSPRAAKLASLLGRMAPKAEEEASQAAPAAAEAAKVRWYPPVQKR